MPSYVLVPRPVARRPKAALGTVPTLALSAVITLFALIGPSPAYAQSVEGPAGTLLVAGMDADAVWLVDLATGQRRAVVETHIAPHEVAVSNEGSLALITNYGDERGPGNLVQVVDVVSGEVIDEIVVDGYERLHGAAFLPGDSLFALTSERTGEILIVGLDDGAVRRALETGGRASHMLSLGGPWIYTANISDGTVSRIDPAGERAPDVWAAGTRTEGLAATPDGSEGWTGSMEGGDVTGIDGATGDVVARVTGLQVPYRLAVTPDGATVVVSDPEAEEVVLIDRVAGVITARIDIAEAAARGGLSGSTSPQGFTLSRDGRWAFVSTKGIDRVALVDLATAEVVAFIESPMGPDGIAVSPATGR